MKSVPRPTTEVPTLRVRIIRGEVGDFTPSDMEKGEKVERCSSDAAKLYIAVAECSVFLNPPILIVLSLIPK